MNIKTKQNIRKLFVSDLEYLKAYVILDATTLENQVIIVLQDHSAVILQRYDNDESLCILKLSPDREVNVIGMIEDFDIVNVRHQAPE